MWTVRSIGRIPKESSTARSGLYVMKDDRAFDTEFENLNIVSAAMWPVGEDAG